MTARDAPPPSESAWEPLLALEQRLEAELAAAAAEARQRVARASAEQAATEPDPEQLNTLAKERARARLFEHQGALARLAQQAEQQAQQLAQAPQALVDRLARQALDAVLQDLSGEPAP